MWPADELARWSCWQEILTPEEFPRKQDYIELYRQQLAVLCGGRPGEPLATDRFAAMRRAAVVWDFARVTLDIRKAAIKRRGQSTRGGERAELLSESEMRRRLNNLCLDELDQADRFAAAAAGRHEALNIVPMRTAR